MNDSKLVLNTKSSIVILGVAVLVLAGAVGFSYYEASNMRRDLYAVRDDYYAEDDGSAEEKKLGINILSQKVEDVRVIDDAVTPVYAEDGSYTETYKTVKARVVEVEITNNFDYMYSYYQGSLSAVDENGVIDRGIVPHVDDDKNTKERQYGVELAPGGKTTVFIYFKDTGKEITELHEYGSGYEAI